MFSYPGQIGGVSFDAHLHESDGLVTGVIEEVDDLSDGHGPKSLEAFVNGVRHGRHVEFQKTYEEGEDVCIVDYQGIIDAEATEIDGEWVRPEDGLAGSFVMHRHARQPATEQREAEADVPVR
jgi:hypothetical protein